MYISHLIYPFVCHWTLGCFHIFAIVKNATMNMRVQIYLRDPVLNYFGYILKSDVAQSYGNSIFNNFEEVSFCFP